MSGAILGDVITCDERHARIAAKAAHLRDLTLRLTLKLAP
ncbi:hypothetical protein APY04_0206 [Hyphomicrobium sulfonivorans]|uniref:Uncharacterized protein n=1 Tax=Hyphomicrobium sulfonivorans TaxID=121290 RepID=A0A125NW65_HYPSL|nr:hypothetical protein APY04_0206 [Hyphomicrobium sulfonivorans]